MAKKDKEYKRYFAKPKGQNQTLFWEAMEQKDLVINAGPAGVGKTHLAIGFAVEQFLAQRVNKIILTRPIIEAGERIGFLPGTAEDKLSPYLIPLMDELSYFTNVNEVEQWKLHKILEVIPLGLMRGRTLKNAIIVADEMQNATWQQLKMLVTRLGQNSKMIIVGDLSQSDLHSSQQGALLAFIERLMEIDEVGICRMENRDIVRNPLIAKILEKIDDSNNSG
jgi:phosphate starvation-inducible protein PhoH and related proteins